MRLADAIVVLLGALGAMGAWMVMLVRMDDLPAQWAAWSAVFAPMLGYVAFRNDATWAGAACAAVVGGPLAAGAFVLASRLRRYG